ncbi:HepT-like ribonuclease domain-containing protein [Sphingomonas sp. BK580]|uniref:HepT-like ribonuclease domain-containing protein n=1 Tax=Sphingomonas sp. BK580 TaxID=2586972 RepID=UPI00288A47CD|nr:HepT-like ribonuclease domain-containing protein [Sphingomonas sp. BK580]
MSVSTKDASRCLREIVDNAERIDAYADERAPAHAGAQSHRHDVRGPRLLRTQEHGSAGAAQTRERNAEAVVKLGPEQFAAIAPDVPFERVRGLGNVLRHAYDDIDLTILFGLVRNDVPALRQAALRALEG